MTDPHSEPTLGPLPRLSHPERYQGLYVVDFGDGVSVGYLAAEVATLFACGQFPQMRAYRIHRALPDGTVEMVRVRQERFARHAEEGLLFLRADEALARDDFDTLRDLADGKFPCPARLELAEISGATWPFMTVLIYPDAYTDDVSRFLLSVHYEGGETVEVGVHKLVAFRQRNPRIIERAEVAPSPQNTARLLEHLLTTRHFAVQR